MAGVVLAILAASRDRLPGDLSATRTVQAWPFPGETFADIERALTGTEVVVAIGVALAVVAWLAGARRPAVIFVVGLALVVLLQFALKEIVDRPRPAPDLVEWRATFSSASFPAGHAMSPTYVAGFLAAALLAAPVSAAVRMTGVAVVIAFLGLAGLANVFVGVHWTSDVIGGYVWAVAVLVPAAAFAFPVRTPAPS